MKTIFNLAIKSIRYRKSILILSIASIALSVVLILGVERLRSEVHDSFMSSISGTDLIVGARTSNVPLLLSSVFYMGNANQNVQWHTYEEIASLPQVSWTIPISLGDSHKGYTVLGTINTLFNHYKFGDSKLLNATSGNLNLDEFNCVIGKKVANALGYKVGDKIVITHGGGQEDFITHENSPFTVEGILDFTGTPLDQTVIVSLFEMDKIHENLNRHLSNDYDVFSDVPDERHHHEGCNHHYNQEANSITACLIGLKDKAQLLQAHRQINNYEEEPLTAILPAVTLFELWEIIEPIEKTLTIIALLVLIVALGGILTTLLTSLNQRKREIAILRSIGARPKHIFSLLLIESVSIVIIGILVGVIVLQLFTLASKPIIAEELGVVINFYWLSGTELLQLASIVVLGSFMGLIPAYQSYKSAINYDLMVTK